MAQGPIIFDRKLLRARRRRAVAMGPATFLLDRVADDIADRLATVLRRFDLAVDLGTPGDAVRQALAGLESVGTIVAVDADAGGLRPIADCVSPPTRRRCRSAMARSISSSRRCRCNSSTICRARSSRSAARSSRMACSSRRCSAARRLTELRQSFAAAESEVEAGASPRVAPFADLRELGALLQRAGFALPVTDVDRVTVRYAIAFALMHDLRRMGATNALVERRRTPLRRATLLRMAEIYARALCRRRRPPARDLRDRLAVGLGAACEPAAAAQAGLGEDAARRCAGDARSPGWREGGAVSDYPNSAATLA